MPPLLCLLGVSFALGLIFTLLARKAAARLGLVDAPDGRRKIHAQPTPVTGGIAVFLAASFTLASALWLAPASFEALVVESASLGALLFASLIICAVGLLDDARGLRGRHKLLGQLVAVTVVIASGTVVHTVHIFDWEIELGYLSIPFTVFWLLGAINALNLIDGMDGLLGSVGVILCLGMSVIALTAGHVVAAAVSLSLAGALLAFLCFNFPPASIFLGDCGSMLVGLVVGVLAIQSSLKGPATVALATPAALLTIPIFDTLAAITRRKLTGRSIYSTDRGHIHHCLRRSGLSPRAVLALVSGLCSLLVLGALASVAFNNELLALLAAITVVTLLVVRRLFGYVEAILIRENLYALAAVLTRSSARPKAHQLQVRLQGSAEWPELWQSLLVYAQKLQLSSLCLDVNAPSLHEGYHARWGQYVADDVESPRLWRAELSLVSGGHLVGRLEVTGVRDSESLGEKMGAVARLAEEVERVLASLTFSEPTTQTPLPDVPRLRNIEPVLLGSLVSRPGE